MAFDYTNYLEDDTDVEADFEFTNRAGTVDSGLEGDNSAGEWSLNTSGSTTSSGTGPTSHYTGRSGFVYTETSTPSASTTWAMKRNDSFDNTTQDVYLDIAYNLNVDTDSEFYVEYATVASPNETTDWTILETIEGTATDSWIDDTFDFSGVASTTTLWIRIRYSAPSSYTCDLAFSTWNEYSVDTGGSYDQTSFRGRDDDDSETSATWKAAVNTDWNQVQDENFRVRFLVQEDDDVEDLNVEFQLQYNLNAGGWNDVNGSSSVVRSFASSEFTDGDHCTQQLGSGTFIGSQNGMDEVNGLAGGANLDWSTTANQETEVEYCCQIRSADTSRGDTIELRLVKEEDTTFSAYTSTPEMTIPEGAGMVLASAYLSGVSAGAEDPGAFDFEKSLPWGAITIALRKSSASASDILDFDNVTVVGDVYNDNTGVPLQINATGGSSLTAGDPGTGDGQTDIQNQVDLTVTVLAKSTGSPIAGASVYGKLISGDGGAVVMNGETNASGVYTTTYNYSSSVTLDSDVSAVRSSSQATPYQDNPLSGSITANGYEITVLMIED